VGLPHELEVVRRSLPAGTAFVERRNLLARDQLVQRIRREFREWPTLSLTLAQASRLFGVPEAACLRIFAKLALEGALRLNTAGAWVRCDAQG
jgi:hypothetical protein